MPYSCPPICPMRMSHEGSSAQPNLCHSLVCADPCSQPTSIVGCLAGTAVTIYGAVTINIPVATLGAISAIASLWSTIRTSCLGPLLQFGLRAEEVNHSIDRYVAESKAQHAENERLQSIVTEMTQTRARSEEDHVHKMSALEADSNEKSRALTEQIDLLRSQIDTLRAALDLLGKELNVGSEVIDRATSGMSDEQSRLRATVTVLMQQVSFSKEQLTVLTREKAQLQQTVEEIRRRKGSEQVTVAEQKKQAEKELEAIRTLKAAEEEALRDLQARTEEYTQKWAAIEQQMKELRPEYERIIATLEQPPK